MRWKNGGNDQRGMPQIEILKEMYVRVTKHTMDLDN